MLELTTLGRPKMEVAKESTALFQTGLRLQPGLDCAAIVAFNQEAQTLQTLTSDRAALQEAVARVRLAEQSRVDRGLDRATVEPAATRVDGAACSRTASTPGRTPPRPTSQSVNRQS